MRVPWLADVLRAAGLTVVECPGWKGRGKTMTGVSGVVLHHTATPATALDAGVVRILRDGRADLPGPLCQLGLDRSGRWHLIADGRGNHNGKGKWGNSAIGVEAFNNGVGEPWPHLQLDSYQRGVAAILRHLGLPASHALGHRETDPKRKTDPKGIDLDAFRERVSHLLGDDDVTDGDIEKIAKRVAQLLMDPDHLGPVKHHIAGAADAGSRLARAVRVLEAKD